MRVFAVAALATLGLSFAAPAWADAVHDRSEAIRVCRAEVAERAQVDPQAIRFDNIRAHGRNIRVDLALWSAGALTHVRCQVSLGDDGAQVASIEPPLAGTEAAR